MFAFRHFIIITLLQYIIFVYYILNNLQLIIYNLQLNKLTTKCADARLSTKLFAQTNIYKVNSQIVRRVCNLSDLFNSAIGILISLL